ncbi:MAG: hypothetical protein ACOYLH_05720, partial [Flavobacteriales bacterium]
TNCIIYGNNALLNDFSELVIDLVDEGTIEYQFSNCLVDTDINVNTDSHFSNCVNGQAPPFCSAADVNFRLSSNPGILAGVANGIVFDINGLASGDFKGCYDFDFDGSPCN